MQDELIPSSQLRKMLGAASQMAIWRWLRLPNDPLPPPAAILGRRRFWRASEVECWLARRAPAARKPIA